MNDCTKTFETKRLILREFRLGDAEKMFENWASSEKVTKYLSWQAHSNVDETREILGMWLDAYKNTDSYNWAIAFRDTDEPFGNIGIIQEIENGDALIGYVIGEKWWGKGYTTEAFKAVIKYLFEEVGVKTVSSYHHIDNPASGKVMMKCGLKYLCQEDNFTNNFKNKCTVKKYQLTKSEYEMLCLQK